MATNDKPTIYYRVVVGHNPKNTDEVIKRPVITRRENYSIGRVIKAAIDSGRIRGKFYDLNGIVNGFMDQVKVLLEEGKAVNANFMRLHAELGGQLGSTEMITLENGLTTCVTPLSELKLDIDNFNWQRVDDSGIKLSITTIKGAGCKIGSIKSNALARINGRNCIMGEGDSVVLKLGDELVVCEILSSDEDTIEVMIPEIDEKYFNTEVMVIVNSRCGIDGGPLQKKDQKVKLLAADEPTEPTIKKVTSTKLGRTGAWGNFGDTLIVEGAKLGESDIHFELVKADGTAYDELDWVEPNSITRERDGRVKIVTIANTGHEPDGHWENTSNHICLTVGNAEPVDLEIV